ncbi:hypothetical protein FE782_19085 [Paenibacillus antri]|uniref:Uncharacterized protein n=1 Tax=Paenibacillus antri TaxID=2582848 RepID=A0A5R9G9N8_9BACL|nr:hypothetical protein [Paenibacillus antri]TLS50800.1 hypothetical protein FE782_19085 [Paenibacillus antri]
MGLPLAGENVFNPITVSPRDIIQGLEVVKIQAFEGTPDYPHDTVLASFRGRIIVTGKEEYLPEDKEFGSDQMVVLFLDTAEEKDVPISHHGRWEQMIAFNNLMEASTSLHIQPGEVRENVTILLEDNTYAFLPTDAYSVANFVRIVD